MVIAVAVLLEGGVRADIVIEEPFHWDGEHLRVGDEPFAILNRETGQFVHLSSGHVLEKWSVRYGVQFRVCRWCARYFVPEPKEARPWQSCQREECRRNDTTTQG